MTFCSCCNLIVSDFMTCEVYRSGLRRLSRTRRRYLDIIIDEPCPGLDVLCGEGHYFFWDIIPGLLRWLVWCSVHRRILCWGRPWWGLAEQRWLFVGLLTSRWVIWWLVRGLGGGHCRGMDQKCTRVDARYGCQPLTQPRLATRMAANTTNPATPTPTLPSTEDKAAFEAAKKDLVQALTRKRNADKQLVSSNVLSRRGIS